MVPGTLVPNTNIIDCKWVYRLKRDKDGTITRYKARFVEKGFHQQSSVAYHNTFSPVIRSITIRVVLSLSINTKMVPLTSSLQVITKCVYPLSYFLGIEVVT